MADEFYYVGFYDKEREVHWVTEYENKKINTKVTNQSESKVFRTFEEAKEVRDSLWKKGFYTAFITSDISYVGNAIYSEHDRSDYKKGDSLVHIFKDEYYGRLHDDLFKYGTSKKYDMIVKPFMQDEDTAVMVIHDITNDKFKKLIYKFSTGEKIINIIKAQN